MSGWFRKLIPRNNQVTQAQELSERENDMADVEQASAVAKAVLSAETAQAVHLINYNNGFSAALGSAFAKRGTV